MYDFRSVHIVCVWGALKILCYSMRPVNTFARSRLGAHRAQMDVQTQSRGDNVVAKNTTQYRKCGKLVTKPNTTAGMMQKPSPLQHRQTTLMGQQSVHSVGRNTIGFYTVIIPGTQNKCGTVQKLISSATCAETQVPPAVSSVKSLHIVHVPARNNIGRQAINATAKRLLDDSR